MATRAAIDPILLEVLRNRLDAIADEMELTLLKSAASPIVKEGLDASAALFNLTRRDDGPGRRDSDPPRACCSSPPSGSSRAFPPETMHEGDAFLLNDPYDGGTHLPDITLARPRLRGRAVSWPSPARCATTRTSAAARRAACRPTPPSSTRKASSSRPPSSSAPACWTRTSSPSSRATCACPTCSRATSWPRWRRDVSAGVRLRELFVAHGSETVLAYIEELLARAERLTRAQIETIPDGDYAFEDYSTTTAWT